jgi:uncharacterized protein
MTIAHRTITSRDEWERQDNSMDIAEIAQAVTAGFLCGTLRAVDEDASWPGAPALPCRTAEAGPLGDLVHYRIPLAPNARYYRAGHRLRVALTGDDQAPDTPAIMGFRHASVGTSNLNTVAAPSRLRLPLRIQKGTR